MAAGQSAALDLALELPARGDYATTLTLQRGAETLLTLHPPLRVPELLTVALSRRHVFTDGRARRCSSSSRPNCSAARATADRSDRDRRRAGDHPARRVVHEPRGSVAGVAPGPREVVATLHDGEQRLGEARAALTLHPRPKVWFDERNVCFVSGQPFFPLGMYHVAWQSTREQMLQCVDDLAAAGFNTVHTSCTSLDTFEAVLDRARERGLMVIAEGVANRPEALRRFADHPAILAWNSGDEPDVWNVAPEQVGRHIDAVLDTDPGHPLYTTVADPALLRRYGPYADIFSNDPYPVRKPDSNTIAVAHQTALAREAVQQRRPVWIVPQCFGYPDGPWAVPTPAQERSMSYQALIEGANGLIWDTYDDVKFKLNEHPEVLAMMRQLTREIRALPPLLLDPDAPTTRFQAGPDGCLRACAIRDARSVTILAAHTNATDLGPMTLKAPGLPAQGTAEVLFEDRHVAIANGQLVDAFGAYGVHAYRVAW